MQNAISINFHSLHTATAARTYIHALAQNHIFIMSLWFEVSWWQAIVQSVGCFLSIKCLA